MCPQPLITADRVVAPRNGRDGPHEATASSVRGSERANPVAEAIARCHPAVVCSAHDVPPPPILDALLHGTSGATGPEIETCGDDVVATAIDVGKHASATYTATDERGLPRMADALFDAPRRRLPIVMTVCNAAGGQAVALRDSGWIQLYPSGGQDVVDVHVEAFRIAESLSAPVMICIDELASGGAAGPVRAPTQEAIDSFLARGGPRSADLDALRVIREVAGDFRARFGRDSGGLLASRLTDDATTVVLGLGSVLGSVGQTVADLRHEGVEAGAVAIWSFRPFPARDLARVLAHCRRVVVVERAVVVGSGGILSADVRAAMIGLPVQTLTAIVGPGTRSVSAETLERLIRRAAGGDLRAVSFLDPPPPRTGAPSDHRARPRMSWQRDAATLL